jgi:glycosyltransferase involved in cell wall biosynthesis
MRIGVVVDNELNDDKRVLRETEILNKAGHRIFVLCFGFNSRNYKPIEGINVTRIRISKNLKDFLFFFLNTIPVYEWLWSARIKKFIGANGIDILHVHDLYMSRAGRSGIRKSGRRIDMVLDLHENYPYAVTTYNWTKGFFRNMLSRPLAWQKKEKQYLGYADRIIVLSDDFRDLLTGRFSEFLIFLKWNLKGLLLRRSVLKRAFPWYFILEWLLKEGEYSTPLKFLNNWQGKIILPVF